MGVHPKISPKIQIEKVNIDIWQEESANKQEFEVEFYVCPRLQPCLKEDKIEAKALINLESTSNRKNYGSDGRGKSAYNRQPGTFVPLVGEAGDSETLPSHPPLSPPHRHRLPRLPQLQVSVFFAFLDKDVVFAKQRKGGSPNSWKCGIQAGWFARCGASNFIWQSLNNLDNSQARQSIASTFICLSIG